VTPPSTAGLAAEPRHVRRAELRDLPALTELWIAITRHHAPLDPLFRLRRGAEPEVRELLRAMLRDPDARAFVCEAGDAAVGMACVRVDRAPPILDEAERAEITDLFVRPAWRRRGCGSALARTAVDWAASRGIRRVEVRVAAANAEGEAFWRAFGFGDHMRILQLRLGDPQPTAR